MVTGSVTVPAAREPPERGGGNLEMRHSSAPPGRVGLNERYPRVPSADGGLHPWLHSSAPYGAQKIPPEVTRTNGDARRDREGGASG